MKAIATNIHLHENGTLYFVARKSGRLFVRSLKTKDLDEARRFLRERGTASFFGKKGPTLRYETTAFPRQKVNHLSETELVNLPVSSIARPNGMISDPAVCVPVKGTKPSLTEALDAHDQQLLFDSGGTQNMIALGRKAILRFSKNWDDFSCIKIWKLYRENGLRKKPRKVTAGTNHLLWYFRKFVPWAIEQGYLPASEEAALRKLKKTKVNPRRIRVAESEKLEELLQMVESEDSDGGAYLRFLACAGPRRGGAAGLDWSDIDFTLREATFRQRDGRTEVIPLSDEAIAVLESRKGRKKPFDMDLKAIERLERRLKRFAKGLDLDITYFHALRHNFASQALVGGLNPKEVAKLLGHRDGGVLVLKTYGHLIEKRLKDAVRGFRITPPENTSKNENDPQK